MSLDSRTAVVPPKTRVGGGVLCVAVAMLGKFALLDPIRDAELHQEQVHTSAAVVTIPMFAALGVALLVLGNRATDWMKSDEARPVARKVIILGFLAAGFALYFWQQHQLAQFGYR